MTNNGDGWHESLVLPMTPTNGKQAGRKNESYILRLLFQRSSNRTPQTLIVTKDSDNRVR